jgi:hypothetical protein
MPAAQTFCVSVRIDDLLAWKRAQDLQTFSVPDEATLTRVLEALQESVHQVDGLLHLKRQRLEPRPPISGPDDRELVPDVGAPTGQI